MIGAANTTGANSNIIIAVLRVIDSRQRLLDWDNVGLSEAAGVLTAEFIFSSVRSRGELQFFHLTFVCLVAAMAINAIDGDAHPTTQRRRGAKARSVFSDSFYAFSDLLRPITIVGERN
jgi:hypothetical protein